MYNQKTEGGEEMPDECDGKSVGTGGCLALSCRAKVAWVASVPRNPNGHADADTMRWRFLQDRKGLLCGCFTLGGNYHEIRHSLRRSDSYDVCFDGRIVFSGGRVPIGKYVAGLLA